MPSFKHSHIDFSRGEVSDKNVSIATSVEKRDALSYLENAQVTRTKGIKRRTGTLKGPKLFYPVDSENKDVFTFPFYVDEDNTFLGVMYSVLSTDLSGTDRTDFETAAKIQSGSRAMVFEFFRFNGELYTFDTRILQPFSYSDVSQIASAFTFNNHLKNFPNDDLSEAWPTVKDYNMVRYRNIGIFTHVSGKVEPFCIFYNGNNFEFSSYKNMPYNTDPGTYGDVVEGWVASLPMTLPNVNKRIALEVKRTNAVSTTSFTITARSRASTTGAFGDHGASPDIHPFKGISNIVRVGYLGKTYYLQYLGNNVGGSPEYLYDPSDISDANYDDEAFFQIIVDHSGASQLATVVGTGGLDTTDFQVEEFSPGLSYPTNCEIYSQRIVFRNDQKIFNTAVGNLFFLNQYRLDGDPVEFSSYVGAKTDSDPFDFSPIQEDYSKASWLSRVGRDLVLGGFSNVLNIGPSEDSVYSFTSINADEGVNEGSLSSISDKVSNYTLFIGEDNLTLRDYRYDGRVRSFISNNLSQLNKEIMFHGFPEGQKGGAKIKHIAVDSSEDTVYLVVEPDNIVLNKRAVVSFRYSLSDEISSWSRVTFGEDLTIESSVYHVSYVKASSVNGGVLTFIVERGGEFYVEHLSSALSSKDANPTTRFSLPVWQSKDLHSYLDFSSRFLSGTAKRVWDLGEDYQRTTVDVVADGYHVSGVSIGADGILNLDRDVATIVVGFPQKTRMVFLPIEPSQGSLGDTLGDIKTVQSVHLRLHNSYGGSLKVEGSSYSEKIPYDSDNMIIGTSLEMFSGFVEVTPESCSGEDLQIEIETSKPYPFELSAIVVKGEVNEG